MAHIKAILVICLIFSCGLAFADPEETSGGETSSTTASPGEENNGGEKSENGNEKVTPGAKSEEEPTHASKIEEKPAVVDKKEESEEKKAVEKKHEETDEEKKEEEKKIEEKKTEEKNEEHKQHVENQDKVPADGGDVESLAKLAEIANVESTSIPSKKDKEHSGETGGDKSEEKEKSPKGIKVDMKETKEIGNLNPLGEVKTQSQETHLDKVEKIEKSHKPDETNHSGENAKEAPALLGKIGEKPEVKKNNVIGSDVASSTDAYEAGNKPHKIEVPPPSGYSSANKSPADHKMTLTEQNSYLCSLPKLEEDLCPMTINLEENVGISDPGANAFCNDVIAAPMGYKGFCVVLMKTNPETGLPIYTRTCAYYDKDKNKCSTNFLTAQAQGNSSQVAFKCDNGLLKYIPTSCVKKYHEHVV